MITSSKQQNKSNLEMNEILYSSATREERQKKTSRPVDQCKQRNVQQQIPVDQAEEILVMCALRQSPKRTRICGCDVE